MWNCDLTIVVSLWLWVDHGVSTIVVSLLGVNIVAYCMINLSVLPSTDVLASGVWPLLSNLKDPELKRLA